jgi:hypothetical protein
MIPLLVILTISLLSNLKGEALHHRIRMMRLLIKRLQSSKLRLLTLILYLSLNPKANLGRLPLQRHLDGQRIKGKSLLFLTMSTAISHHLRWCVTLGDLVIGENKLRIDRVALGLIPLKISRYQEIFLSKPLILQLLRVNNCMIQRMM